MSTHTGYYQVGGHLFAIIATPEVFAQLPNYTPFEQSAVSGQQPVFSIRLKAETIPSPDNWEHVYTDQSDEDIPRIEMYRRAERWLFCMSMYRESEIICAIECSSDWREVNVYHTADVRFAIDNAAMLVYAFATAAQKTLLFHASVVMREGKGYLFLGHSGTGKSTHSRQWLSAFADAELLNDDNPVVRINEAGEVRVYGSPWSGKTACYKNTSAPVQALVQLAQAPENHIVPLRMTQAYPYILASISGLKMLPDMMDRLYETIAQLLEYKPVYKLECLPNTDAARLCAQTC